MSSPKCRNCGAEGVWGKTKAGKPLLMVLRPHFIYCPARRDSARQETTGARADAVEALKGMQFKKREAEKLVAQAKGDTVAALVGSALKLYEEEK